MLIDTNVFLEVLLNQRKAADCKTLLKKVSTGSISPRLEPREAISHRPK
jgi:predicted nucleic acid-binding protein